MPFSREVRSALRVGLCSLACAVLIPCLYPSRALADPWRGFWNGFNSHLEVLECGSYDGAPHTLQLQLHDAAGTLVAEHSRVLPAFGTSHTILNELAPLQDRYGSITVTSAQNARIHCVTATYRPNARGGLDYVFLRGSATTQTGTAAGIYNSFDPSYRNAPVENWLTVQNSGTAQFTARVDLFHQDGSFLRSIPLPALPIGGRYDLALGHDNAAVDGQEVGLFRVVPSSEHQPYLAQLIRYGRAAGALRFVLPVEAEDGGCSSGRIPVSIVAGADNWLELANLGESAFTVTARIRDAAGQQKGVEELLLQPRAQAHLWINSVLTDGQIGSVEVSCSTGDAAPLIAQAVLYAREGGGSATDVRWAYVSRRVQPAAAGSSLVFPLNTYLGSANWLKLVNPLDTAGGAAVELYAQDGAHLAELPVGIVPRGAYDLPLHEASGNDRVGTVAVQATGDHHPVVQPVRAFHSESGALEQVVPVPGAVFTDDDALHLTLEPFIEGLSAPVFLTHAGDSRLFIVERAGRVRIVEDGALLAAPFLDISAAVGLEGEQGLHAIAFHPNYAANGRFYVHYNDRNGDTVVARFRRATGDANRADTSSEQLVLTVAQPHFFHNGGALAFGPDGYLYLGLGDGGLAGDPLGYAQDLGSLLGSILRIDVDGAAPYTVPADNPFVGMSGARPEIWAYGFRNPWRFSFDRQSGRLFAGDVGQSTSEEINLVLPGGNYGWNRVEGRFCFLPPSGCDRSGLTAPLAEYSHAEGVAVVGGYVYRGSTLPRLAGTYIFADYAAGALWGLTEEGTGHWNRRRLFRSSGSLFISSLGEDHEGELYVVGIEGTIFRIALAGN